VLTRLYYGNQGNAAHAGLPSLSASPFPERSERGSPSPDGTPAYVAQMTSRSQALDSFHWLRAAERIQCKLVNLANIVYRSLYGTALGYLAS
jgi:hypothetical protein